MVDDMMLKECPNMEVSIVSVTLAEKRVGLCNDEVDAGGAAKRSDKDK